MHGNGRKAWYGAGLFSKARNETGVRKPYMGSPSSKTNLDARIWAFCMDYSFILPAKPSNEHFIQLNRLLETEYHQIPEKERIGKGRVYISRIAGDTIARFNVAQQNPDENMFQFCVKGFEFGDKTRFSFLHCVVIYIIAARVKDSSALFEKWEHQILIWVCNDDWEIREMTNEFIVVALQHYPDFILPKMRVWAQSSKENIRRWIIEGARPHGPVKWLRNPTKIDPILDLLTMMRFESSEYARKSIGNALKDLSKYMPEKVLILAENWIASAKIHVSDDLASKSKAVLGADHFYLIWILKFGLRWLHERHPELHESIQRILGQNYIHFFHEKKNFGAKPK